MNAFTQSLLRKAGWFPGRTVGTELFEVASRLAERKGIEFFPAAMDIVREFGGLTVRYPHPRTLSDNYIIINPTMIGADFDPKRARDFAKEGVFPVGLAASGWTTILIGQSGTIFEHWDGETALVADGVLAAFDFWFSRQTWGSSITQ